MYWIGENWLRKKSAHALPTYVVPTSDYTHLLCERRWCCSDWKIAIETNQVLRQAMFKQDALIKNT